MPLTGDETWICLDCARLGGHQQRCPDCDNLKDIYPSLKEKAARACHELKKQFIREHRPNDVAWRDEMMKMGAIE